MDLNHISHTHPHPHEAILENNPGQEKDEGLVAAVEGRHVSGSQLLQGQEVKVVGKCPQNGEGCCLLHKELESHPVFSKEPAALPWKDNKGVRVTPACLQLEQGLCFQERCGLTVTWRLLSFLVTSFSVLFLPSILKAPRPLRIARRAVTVNRYSL